MLRWTRIFMTNPVKAIFVTINIGHMIEYGIIVAAVTDDNPGSPATGVLEYRAEAL